MTALLKIIDHKQAIEITRSTLIKKTSFNHFDQLTIDCALIRNYLWTLSNKGTEPVHIRRLLNMAVQVEVDDLGSLHLAEQRRRERLHEALNELSNSLDIFELPNGRWMPAPVRLVHINNSGEYLLIGGLPTNLLPEDIANEVIHHGPFRRVKGNKLCKAFELPTESLCSWLNIPSEDLLLWSKEIMEKTVLEPFELKDISRFEIYFSQKPVNLQVYRWVENSQNIRNGRYLARRYTVMGLNYRIAEIKNNQIIKLGIPMFGFGDPRRLMYGIDALNNNPIKVAIEKNSDSFCVTIQSELPRAENRLFAALGMLTVPEDKYYPRIWHFNKNDIYQIENSLKTLKVKFS